MTLINFNFQVHMPYFLNKYRIYDIGKNTNYFDEEKSKELIEKYAKESYIPLNRLLLNLIKLYPNQFKFSIAISGILIEQLEKYSPDTLNSFIELSKTGQVEFLAQTYYNSFSFLYSKDEFNSQIIMHKRIIEKYFNQTPTIFRNINNSNSLDLIEHLSSIGFRAVVSDFVKTDSDLKNKIYSNESLKDISLISINDNLSNDVSINFSNKSWDQFPLTSQKYISWINKLDKNADLITINLSYNQFADFQMRETGIFDFFQDLVVNLLKNNQNQFTTINRALDNVYKFNDTENLISNYLSNFSNNPIISNDIQKEAIKEVFNLEKVIKSSKDMSLITNWRKLTTSDHFYYMSDKYLSSSKIQSYESEYKTYVYFMNSLTDLNIRIKLKQDLKIARENILKNPRKGSILSDIKNAVNDN